MHHPGGAPRRPSTRYPRGGATEPTKALVQEETPESSQRGSSRRGRRKARIGARQKGGAARSLSERRRCGARQRDLSRGGAEELDVDMSKASMVSKMACLLLNASVLQLLPLALTDCDCCSPFVIVKLFLRMWSAEVRFACWRTHPKYESSFLQLQACLCALSVTRSCNSA